MTENQEPQQLLSVVVPAYSEQEVLPEFHRRIKGEYVGRKFDETKRRPLCFQNEFNPSRSSVRSIDSSVVSDRNSERL